MIGKPVTGASFYDCLRYCLEDKKIQNEEDRIKRLQESHLQHRNRAEILDYNNCFAPDAKKLASQFIRVAKLSKKVENPVYHFTLRAAPGDVLSKEQWIEIGKECAKEYGVENNQYVIILHKDTNEPHIHIVANRVGFDGKVAKDTYSVKRMHALCRRLEQKYHLKEVLSSRTFLPEELRHLPRHDIRKEKLRADIQQTLKEVKTYGQFEEKMKSLGYTVLKGRGICFIDEKKVRIKGSDVGFSLSKIDRILQMKQHIAKKEELLKAKQKLREIEIKKQQSTITPAANLLKQFKEKDKTDEISIEVREIEILKKAVKEIIYDLFKTEQVDQSVAPELMREAKQKKKRHRPRL